MKGYNYKKAAQLINYFAAHNYGAINKMKAFKLIWLVNRLHLRRYARTVTGDTHYAMVWGPVPSNTKDFVESKVSPQSAEKQYFDQYLSLDGQTITSIQQVNAKVFSETDLEAADEILKNYNALDQFELATYSHYFPEWKRFQEKIETSGSSYKMDINDFFENYIDDKGLFNDKKEDLEIAKELFFETANA
ncbi:Panacea domain-containing protein [Dyadobacter sp. CY347]|uniref:Panacea domain-containing protein n=1 Tax=Dyadobacter sp. CY347 TaxID=2909336 RepID=UPI001F171B75|nr:Panacea domain-containing protein [Dyadobacter sp. CY347]MCF2490213.1 SocA family protein [Dyadobacter sp. CY347]